MEKDLTALRESALQFLKSNKAGVLATVSKEDTPHASVVYYVADDSFNIFFLTKRGSRKYAAISAHPQAAFTIGHLDVPQTLQIEGMVSELRSDEEKAQHVPDLMRKLAETDVHSLPIAKMDSEVVLMWLRPKWIRWGDFSAPGLGDDIVFTEISVS